MSHFFLQDALFYPFAFLLILFHILRFDAVHFGAESHKLTHWNTFGLVFEFTNDFLIDWTVKGVIFRVL